MRYEIDLAAFLRKKHQSRNFGKPYLTDMHVISEEKETMTFGMKLSNDTMTRVRKIETSKSE